MTLPVAALRACLAELGIPTAFWQLPDPTFECVSMDWVTENWEAWLQARPEALVLLGDIAGKRVRSRPLWINEACDCDNLALAVVAHAQVGNALLAERLGTSRGGLAFGFLFYTASPARPENFGVAGPHAINWFVDHDSKVRFFEPGMGREVTLTKSEREVAWFGHAS